MSSDLGLADLIRVCLAKNTNKNMVKCDRPWRPPPSYGRYGAARPATKHATINLYHMRWGCVVKTEKVLILTMNLTIIARRINDDVQRRRIDDEMMSVARQPPPPQLIIQQSTDMLCDRFVY